MRKGGFTTKIPMLGSMEEKPPDFQLTGGQVNDSKEGNKIMETNIDHMDALPDDFLLWPVTLNKNT